MPSSQLNNSMPDGIDARMQIYITSAIARFGFSKEVTKKLLREKFPEFDLDRLSEYDHYLQECREKQLALIRNKDKIIYIDEDKGICPICGARIHNDNPPIMPYSKLWNWWCSKGGKTHYYQARTNLTLTNVGRKPIYEAIDGIRFPGLPIDR